MKQIPEDLSIVLSDMDTKGNFVCHFFVQTVYFVVVFCFFHLANMRIFSHGYLKCSNRFVFLLERIRLLSFQALRISILTAGAVDSP